MTEIQTAIAGIGKYSDALEELNETEKVELRAELEAKKKENFQLVADACMEEYTKTYGEMPENDSWMFLEAEYYGTGGRANYLPTDDTGKSSW